MSRLTAHPVGDRALLVEVADNAAAQRLFRFAHRTLDLEDVIPGHQTVLMVGRDRAPRLEDLGSWESDEEPARADAFPVVLSVTYGGPDLDTVAERCRMSTEELVRRHLAAEYTVAFIGFAPGFPYLIGGDPLIQPPRRTEPRTRVPAGALAIAGEYTSIYSKAGPGGWQIVGSSDALLFDPTRESPALLQPGDTVRLVEGPA
ncbi:5-oxoprolinase subunit B family protein [Patulibacter americanus]|uniref:5-oxoprolinase subunit B family protein n=1 Tax=Patulibacter americanus TaxID=588672 RepID=UPI00040A30E5|nr:allophanate hydrolase subunit 1 [Patulibacter americanus]